MKYFRTKTESSARSGGLNALTAESRENQEHSRLPGQLSNDVVRLDRERFSVDRFPTRGCSGDPSFARGERCSPIINHDNEQRSRPTDRLAGRVNLSRFRETTFRLH